MMLASTLANGHKNKTLCAHVTHLKEMLTLILIKTIIRYLSLL